MTPAREATASSVFIAWHAYGFTGKSDGGGCIYGGYIQVHQGNPTSGVNILHTQRALSWCNVCETELQQPHFGVPLTTLLDTS